MHRRMAGRTRTGLDGRTYPDGREAGLTDRPGWTGRIRTGPDGSGRTDGPDGAVRCILIFKYIKIN